MYNILFRKQQACGYLDCIIKTGLKLRLSRAREKSHETHTKTLNFDNYEEPRL